MKVAGIVGWHNSGKTTLVVALVQELTARGHRVSTIKHAHHEFDVDTPGKDSWLHRDAGATEVMVGSGKRWALMHELRGSREPDLEELINRMNPVDIVLVEGFKNAGHEKIEVFRDGLDDPPIAYSSESVVAVASDIALDQLKSEIIHLDVDDLTGIADFIEQHWSLPLHEPAADSA
ncbi:MAG: molybdopterin-guanine dinucleotide biosynthesis protein B [Alphaproteobacteria bacterium]|nr:molybdopterin-guanine dinucleotide biosynthesis protein B [Alphaproteobacteria bacterium]